MFQPIKPMKPFTVEDSSTINTPCYVQPKIDGIRAIFRLDELRGWSSLQSASGKQLPNQFIHQDMAANCRRLLKELEAQYGPDSVSVRHFLQVLKDGLDGELIVGDGMNFQLTTSGVMSQFGRPDYRFMWFDIVDMSSSFSKRRESIQHFCYQLGQRIEEVPTYFVANQTELNQTVDLIINRNKHEGVVLRSLHSPYKQGRCSPNQAYLARIKPRVDDEAVIVSAFEGSENHNPLELTELGLSKRSTSQEGKVPNGMLGGFTVKSASFTKEFDIGTFDGMTHQHRKALWDMWQGCPESFIGQPIKFRYLKIGSTQEKPRQPIGISFRHPDDMTTY